MRVIGTAGHVDHGKSTLVRALTGINPDRLEEEQRREMTIELGFAWMTLSNGEEIGVIDVPGHRDFIENMLAGIGGIDAVIFVVAADEGVMPQTREHLAILDILGIPTGVVALTKTDLIDDPEWLGLVIEDLQMVFEGTVLENSPIIQVSARTGDGLSDLTLALENRLLEVQPRPDFARPRLPIDRVFTIPGFGTVVTGTLLDGSIKVGKEIEILPTTLKGRIRGLQTHKQKEEIAFPGSRVAVNVTGIEVEQIKRGNVLTHVGEYTPTRRLDVYFRLLKDASVAITHNMPVKLFMGAAETPARVRLLGTDQILPGEEGWLQLELEHPLVAIRKDRYIIRRPSPGETLGGGFVVDPQPARRHKRFSDRVLSRLKVLQNGTPEELLLEACSNLGTGSRVDLQQRSGLSEEEFDKSFSNLLSKGDLVSISAPSSNSNEQIILTKGQWERESQQVISLLKIYHGKFPLRRGIPREELKSRLNRTAKIFNAEVGIWVKEGTLAEDDHYIKLIDHEILFSDQQQTKVNALLKSFKRSPYSPPTVKESQQVVGDDVFQALVDMQELILLTTDVVFRMEDFNRLLVEISAYLQRNDTITVADFRDRYNTSRRYALAFLEYLDQSGITIRDGDLRRLKNK